MVVADFESLFDTWEILGSLAYCESVEDEELKDTSARVWIPVGRNGWRDPSRQRLLQQMSPPRGEFSGLVEAGFGIGSSERLATTVRRYDAFARQLGWW